MRSPDAQPQVDDDQASWIASVAAIATPLGCLASGPLLESAGRRRALLAVNAPSVVGWLLVGLAPRAEGGAGAGFLAQVYAGRALTGVAMGMASVPSTVYAAEVAEPALRGLLVTWTSAAVSFGVLVVYILGWYMPERWRVVALCCAGLPVAAALLLLVLPESPAWLAARGREREAEAALRAARAVPAAAPTPAALRSELEQARVHAQAHAHAAAARGRRGRRGGALAEAWRTLTAPACLKPLLILNGFFFFQQLSGVFVVIFYAVDVVRAAGVALDAYLGSVLIGAARAAVTVLTGFISQRFGRRLPALVSGAGMTACAAALGVWLVVARPSPPDPAPAAWLPVTALLLYIATSTVGFLTLPWAMLGELLPAAARGLAGGFTTCMAYVFSFAMLKLYPSMLEAMGAAGLFFFYAAAALAGTVFVAGCLPETRGRSLIEIEAMFAGADHPRVNGQATAATIKAAEAGEQLQEVELQPLARAS